MDANKVDMFIMSNAKYFEGSSLPILREQLLAQDESKFIYLQSLNFKEPTTSILISVFAGQLGIDRFYIGDTGKGIGKLLTCGGLGVWTIVDYFLIMGATRQKNYELIQEALLH